MKKLDIMRQRDGQDAWDMVNGKITKIVDTDIKAVIKEVVTIAKEKEETLIDEVIDEVLDEIEVKGEEALKYNVAELKAMNKAEQVEILNDMGITKIPRYERDRVAKILSLQEK